MVVFNMLLTCKITGSQTPDLEVFVHFLQLHYSRVKKTKRRSFKESTLRFIFTLPNFTCQTKSEIINRSSLDEQNELISCMLTCSKQK